jgi:hypothetical protein
MVMCLQDTLNNIFYYCFTLEKTACCSISGFKTCGGGQRVVLLRDTLKKTSLYIFLCILRDLPPAEDP